VQQPLIHRATTIPHGGGCCGCLTATIHGDMAKIACNECGVILYSIPMNELDRVLAELSATDQICSPTCPHCGALNTFTGYSTIEAFVCSHCGEGVSVEYPTV
jgi:uncharacterized paraquat-inducible protein A